ncbi:MAG: hypothetical protein ABI885_05735, partial [Gammaproteobacteria bacterium]
TNWFHSDLHLYLDKGVGLFVSFNSAGKEGAAHTARERLFSYFTDRYFPQVPPTLATVGTAKAHGLAMAGHYINSRGASSDWVRFIDLISEVKVSLNEDDTITVSSLLNAALVPKKWREVGPWQWHEVGGDGRLAANVTGDRVTAFSIAAFAPIFVFYPAPAAMNSGLILPLLSAAVVVMLLTALGWPVVALIRRNYGYRPVLAGRALRLHRATRINAWVLLLVVGGWAGVIGALSDVTLLDGRLDIWMRLIQLLTLVGIAGTMLSIWNAYELARSPERGWPAALWAGLVALSALFLVWLLISMRTLTPALNY